MLKLDVATFRSGHNFEPTHISGFLWLHRIQSKCEQGAQFKVFIAIPFKLIAATRLSGTTKKTARQIDDEICVSFHILK